MKYFLFFLFLINPSWSCFIGLIFSLWLLNLGGKCPTLINPYYLFLSTTVSLMLYNPNYSEFYLVPLTGKTLTVIFLGILTFILGLNSFKLKRKKITKDKLFFWTSFILGSLPYILGILNAGIPLLSENPDEVKRLFFIPIIGQLTVFLSLSLVIAFKSKKNVLIFISIFFNVLFSFIVVMKSSLALLFILLSFCFIKYKNIRFSKKFSLLVFSLSITSIFLIFSFFGGIRNKEQNEFYWKSELKFGAESIDQNVNIIAAPYFYSVTSWVNLDHNINYLNDKYQYGKLTLKPLISVLQLDEIIEIEPKKVKTQPWNTHGFITDFYIDFGLLGVLILPLLLGRLVKYIYNNSIYKQNSINDILWVYFALATFMMFFSNHFTSVGYPLIAYIILSTFRFFNKITQVK